MNKQSVGRLLPVLVLALVGFSSCGLGKKIVSDLEFASETVNGVYYAGFDATVRLNGNDLPYVRLPVIDPKNPGRTFGYVDVGGDQLSVRVDVASASRTEVLDGTVLPNGRPIPIALPKGVIPIALPVLGSNTKVYLALGEKNIMAGVALTLKPTDQVGGVIGDLLKFPSNVFFPYKVAKDVKGSAGVFTGSHFGLGVFAVKQQTITGGGQVSFAASSAEGYSNPEHFATKEQSTTTSKMLEIREALRSVETLQID